MTQKLLSLLPWLLNKAHHKRALRSANRAGQSFLNSDIKELEGKGKPRAWDSCKIIGNSGKCATGRERPNLLDVPALKAHLAKGTPCGLTTLVIASNIFNYLDAVLSNRLERLDNFCSLFGPLCVFANACSASRT
jgi:hypothetical protein